MYLITTGLRIPARTVRRRLGNLIDTVAESACLDPAEATCFIAPEGGRK